MLGQIFTLALWVGLMLGWLSSKSPVLRSPVEQLKRQQLNQQRQRRVS